jgi:hypothetical protein
VDIFKCLGQLITYDDANTQAIQVNLRKAQGCWAQILRVLRAENATARSSGMFYKASVQAFLLYGSETWSLSPTSVKRLEGFHIQAAWAMSGLRPEKKPNGSWLYPFWFTHNCPLYGRALADCSKLQGTLCRSSKEEGFAGPIMLVGSADGFGFGKREGFTPPCAGPCGPCIHQGQRRGLKLGTGLNIS